MSQVLSDSASPCGRCGQKSTWDFLRDFYLRVEASQKYARKLEHDLQDKNAAVQHWQFTLRQCEASLASCWETLIVERQEHRVSQDTLKLKRAKLHETIELLNHVFEEARRNAETADFLSSQIVTLQTASNANAYQATSSMENMPRPRGPLPGERPSAPTNKPSQSTTQILAAFPKRPGSVHQSIQNRHSNNGNESARSVPPRMTRIKEEKQCEGAKLDSTNERHTRFP